MSKKKKGRTIGPIAPPIETFAAQIQRLSGQPILSINARVPEPEANLRAFFSRPAFDLSTRVVGTWEHLGAAYENSLVGDFAVRDLAAKVAKHGEAPNLRTNDAGVNLIASFNMIQSAILLHLRAEPWNDLCALIFARTAMECTGRAALIAHGTSDEPHRWDKGPSFSASECIAALERAPLIVPKQAPAPKRVYGWLCNFTHMNSEGIARYTSPPAGAHEGTYAAMAYVAWLVAFVAESVAGHGPLAKWPAVMPSKLPWD